MIHDVFDFGQFGGSWFLVGGECVGIFVGDLKQVLESPTQHFQLLYTVYQLHSINLR